MIFAYPFFTTDDGVKNQDYLDMILMSIESVKLFEPDTVPIVVTDARSSKFLNSLPDKPYVVWITYDELDANKVGLMAARLKAMARAINVVRDNEPQDIWFLDADVILNRPISHFFIDGDLVFTTRATHRDVINCGVIRCTPSPETEEFFEKCLNQLVYSEPKSALQWGGDQSSIANVLKLNHLNVSQYESIGLKDGPFVRLLPVAEWNFTPKENPTEVLKDKIFVHFKGNRKQWMSEYLQKLKQETLNAENIINNPIP